jgi:UDP-GlcNAc:undecaprenyl-phosphate/decaprenyl-phosphate GlcNAc-1-phosphate transferase
MSLALLALLLVTMVLSFFAAPLAGRVAGQIGLLDIPCGHKAHEKPTPLLGGSAVFWPVLMVMTAGLAVANIWAATNPPAWLERLGLAEHLTGAAVKTPQAMGILLSATALHVLGLIDDKRALGPWVKLAVQVVAALAVVLFCGVRVLTLAGPVGSVIVTTLWIVGMTNAMNFLDNMDGLCCGVAAIAAAALLAVAMTTGQWFLAGALAVLLGALLGFWPHNFPPAKIFLGDAGSLVIGFLLACFSAMTTYTRPGQVSLLQGVLVPLMVLAVPLYDTASVFTIRIREGRNPMIGDRRHFSHRLLRRGMTVRTAVLTIYLATAATAVGGVILPSTTSLYSALLLGLQTVAILAIIALLESTRRDD